MKLFHLIHALVTLFLLIVVLSIGGLILAGKIEIRSPAKHVENGLGELPAPKVAKQNFASVIGPAVKAKLIVLRGLKPNLEYSLYEGTNFLGRADEKPVDIDLEIQEPPERIWSSRQHAVITCEKESLVIEDLNSSNGTYVNRIKVPQGVKQPLKANDIIQIGEIQLTVVF